MADDTLRDRDALIATRNALTTASLAVGLLRRKRPNDADVTRLCSHITRALDRLGREARGMEERRARRADREASWHRHRLVQQHPSRHVGHRLSALHRHRVPDGG